MKIELPRQAFLAFRRTIRVVIGFAAMIGVAAPAIAESNFEKGNALYEAGSFAEAAKAYEASIQGGTAGANVYFNLGNANLRAGERGRAVLNYQRALALRPAHPEAATNLVYVQRLLNLPTPPSSAWTQAAEWLGVDAMTVITALGAWTLLAGLVAILGPWRRLNLGGSLLFAGAVPFIAGLFLLSGQGGGARDPERAIVVSEDGARAHYAPADNSRDVQMLPAGSEFRLLQDRGSWVYVEVAGGVRGWVAASAVDTVVPRETVAPGS
jgi:tetratricopeptide (TPR) repeat protein